MYKCFNSKTAVLLAAVFLFAGCATVESEVPQNGTLKMAFGVYADRHKEAEIADAKAAFDAMLEECKITPNLNTIINVIEAKRKKNNAPEKTRDVIAVLNGAAGNCVSLGILYIALGEGVGILLRGVAVPEHFFVRTGDINIEPTMGRATPTRHYLRTYGRYMRELTSGGLKAMLLANRVYYYLQKGNVTKALEDVQTARALGGDTPQLYVNHGLVLEAMGKNEQAVEMYKKALELDPKNKAALHNLKLKKAPLN